MATSSTLRTAQEFRDTTSKLYQDYSQGMENLLLNVEQEDKEDLRQTLDIMNKVAQSIFSTSQEVEKLESSQQDGELSNLKSMIEILISLKQSEADQARQECDLLKEQAELLQKCSSKPPTSTNEQKSTNKPESDSRKKYFSNAQILANQPKSRKCSVCLIS